MSQRRPPERPAPSLPNHTDTPPRPERPPPRPRCPSSDQSDLIGLDTPPPVPRRSHGRLSSNPDDSSTLASPPNPSHLASPPDHAPIMTPPPLHPKQQTPTCVPPSLPDKTSILSSPGPKSSVPSIPSSPPTNIYTPIPRVPPGLTTKTSVPPIPLTPPSEQAIPTKTSIPCVLSTSLSKTSIPPVPSSPATKTSIPPIPSTPPSKRPAPPNATPTPPNAPPTPPTQATPPPVPTKPRSSHKSMQLEHPPSHPTRKPRLKKGNSVDDATPIPLTSPPTTQDHPEAPPRSHKPKTPSSVPPIPRSTSKEQMVEDGNSKDGEDVAASNDAQTDSLPPERPTRRKVPKVPSSSIPPPLQLHDEQTNGLDLSQRPSPHTPKTRNYIDANDDDSDNEIYYNFNAEWSGRNELGLEDPACDDETVNKAVSKSDTHVSEASMKPPSTPISVTSPGYEDSFLAQWDQASCLEEGNRNSHMTHLSWYWGNLSSDEVERKMEHVQDGSFLVRNSSVPGNYTLTVKDKGEVCLFRIYQCDGQFSFSQGSRSSRQRFGSLPALISYYSEHSLAEFSRTITTNLVHPMRKKETMKVSRLDALSILAKRGRELKAGRHSYVTLLKEQKKLNKSILMDKLETKAIETARLMYESLLNAPDMTQDDIDEMSLLGREQQQILSANNSLAMRRRQDLARRCQLLNQKMECDEELQGDNSVRLHDQASMIGDRFEDCLFIKDQLLGQGVKPDFIDCLLDDTYTLEEWDRSQWLVECSGRSAEELLAGSQTGTFLIRSRDSEQRPYALSIICTDEEDRQAVRHCFIHYVPGMGYGFRPEAAVFATIDELVARHAQTSIKLYFSNIDTCLAYPICPQ